MSLSEKKVSELRKDYGINFNSPEWSLKPGELLNYIGQDVLLVENTFTGGNWSNQVGMVKVRKIEDFDPMYLTFDVVYSRYTPTGILAELEEHVTVIPEGNTLMTSEAEDIEDGTVMARFLPMSIHYKVSEKLATTERVTKLFAERDTLGFKAVESLADKVNAKLLTYACNINAVIQLTCGEVLYFRIAKVEVSHKHGVDYKLKLSDEVGKVLHLVIKKDQTEYQLYCGSEKVGVVKIIDLRG